MEVCGECPMFLKELQDLYICTLLSTVYKIFSKIMSERLRPKIEAIVGWYQTGFREGKGTIDQIHTLRQILEGMKEQSIT
jgi:hypothetical protein